MVLRARSCVASGPAARALCAAGIAACMSLATGAAAQVAVVTRTAEDDEVAAQLGALLDVPVRKHRDAETRSLAVLLEDARGWPEPHVVVIDRAADTVYVLRPRDATAVSRVLGAGVLFDSQYAVALATAELLEWLGVLPPARGRPTEPAPATAESSTGDPPRDGAEAAGGPAATGMLGWAAGADLELATSPGFDVNLARPSLSLELQLGRNRKPAWFAFGARLSAPASWDRALASERFSNGVDRIEYSDVQAGAHAAIGFGTAGRAVLFQLEGGVAFASVEALSAAGRAVGSHTGRSPFVGLGVGLRHPLTSALALAAGVQGHWLPARSRYRVQGAPVLEEGPVRVTTRVGLIWESALLP